LAINYCNEKLQNHFIKFVLCREQELYTNEGINFERINPKMNDGILALIDARQSGMFAVLDDEV